MKNLPHRLLDDHAFALHDPLVDEPLPEPVAALAIPLQTASLAGAEHLLPSLLPLRALSAEQRGQMLDRLLNACDDDAPPVLSALLDSALAAPALARELAQRQLIRHRNGSRFLLRYHDPRVATHLSWMLDAPRLRHIFGAVRIWSIPFQGEWLRLPLPAEDDAAPPRAWLDDSQQRRLAAIGAINRLLASQPRAANLAGHQARARIIAGHIERAAGNGLTQEADQIAFARLALDCHPDFHTHPEVRSRLDGLASPEERFADAVATLDPPTLARIKAELEASTPADRSMQA